MPAMQRMSRDKVMRTWRWVCCVLAVGCLGCQAGPVAAEMSDANADLILYDAEGISRVKQKIAAGDAELLAIVKDVVERGDESLEVEPVSVTDKPMTPPSGDKHDYMSIGSYWWPNPDTPDGKPYIRRDGEFNPERDKYDVTKLDVVTGTVQKLALAYEFTGDERYAKHAVKHLRHFFIDPQTRMNPNLQYSQFVPGRDEDGRKSGIIETVRLRFLPDSITLLKDSPNMTDADFKALQKWFADYVHWLQTSENGIGESESENNHGTWYMQQVVLFSLFADDKDTARDVLDKVPARIASQYEPDGSQPLENERTRSLHYCDFNNRAMMDLAHMGESLGYDLWNYESEDGRSLKKGYALLVPYMTGTNKTPWPHKQIDEPKYHWFAQSLRWAANGFDNSEYEAAIDLLPDRFETNNWIELVVPAQ